MWVSFGIYCRRYVLYTLVCPSLIVKSLYDINTGELRELGIRGFIFDLDNTIIPWDSETMQPEVITWMEDLLEIGFKLCLVSNNWNKRVRRIAEDLGIPFVSRAYKPAKTGFRQAAGLMNLPPKEVAVVGDQLFTDILGGNRNGMYTIMVAPLSSQEFIGTKITRKIEKITIHMLRAKGLIK